MKELWVEVIFLVSQIVFIFTAFTTLAKNFEINEFC